MAADPVIESKKLTKQFKTRRGIVTAVAGVDLAVARGETFGLIGPDGAGKTTLLRLLLGLLRRSDGECRVLGYDSAREVFPIRERVGYIAQQFALPADMTVLENLRFFASIQGVSRREQQRRIPELLTFAGLKAFSQRPAGKLSGGMKKKLALACSLVHEPQVLVLDEPTLGVDPVSRREFWNLLGELRANRGLTILVATPYMDEAERCNRVALIYKGRFIACDSPAAIKKRLPGQMLQIVPAELRRAEAVVATLNGVLEVQSYGQMLHVIVDDASRRQPELARLLAESGLGADGIRVIEPRMEEAFISLIRRQRAQEGAGDGE